jgi:hypothetical protein
MPTRILTAPQFEFDSLETPAAKAASKKFLLKIDVQRFHTLSSIHIKSQEEFFTLKNRAGEFLTAIKLSSRDKSAVIAPLPYDEGRSLAQLNSNTLLANETFRGGVS